MRQLRISGLVREANFFREACTCPMTSADRETLSRRLTNTLAKIDEICRRHGVSPTRLPGPTRRAYEFLAQLDLSRLPQTETAPPEHHSTQRMPGSIRFTGLRAFLDGLLDDLALAIHAGRCDAAATLRVVQQTAGRLEHYISRNNLAPGHLKPESRELTAWFRYFSDPAHLDTYLCAVRRVQSVLGAMAVGNSRWKTPFLVHFRPGSHLYRWRAAPGGTRVILPAAMVSFDEHALQHLGRMMLGDRRSWPLVNQAMLSEPYQAVRLALEEHSGPAERSRGITCDLAEVFDAVNRRYFGGQMTRPNLIWTRQPTGFRFGHYDFVLDVVCISSTLDRPDVPRFVLEHVMHHELLHKKHGLEWHGTRQHAHTPEFRAEERAFERFSEADQFLQSLSRRMA